MNMMTPPPCKDLTGLMCSKRDTTQSCWDLELYWFWSLSKLYKWMILREQHGIWFWMVFIVPPRKMKLWWPTMYWQRKWTAQGKDERWTSFRERWKMCLKRGRWRMKYLHRTAVHCYSKKSCCLLQVANQVVKKLFQYWARRKNPNTHGHCYLCYQFQRNWMLKGQN